MTTSTTGLVFYSNQAYCQKTHSWILEKSIQFLALRAYDNIQQLSFLIDIPVYSMSENVHIKGDFLTTVLYVVYC